MNGKLFKVSLNIKKCTYISGRALHQCKKAHCGIFRPLWSSYNAIKSKFIIVKVTKGENIGEEDIIIFKGKKTKTNKVIRTVYIAVWTRSLSLPWPDPNYQDLVILNKICQFASSFGILESLQNHLVLDGVKYISGTHGSKRVN